MISTETDALDAMLHHHRQLTDGVRDRAAALRGGGAPPEAARAELVAYLAGEVLPHAAAEEGSIYPVAAARADLAPAVEAMVAEHRVLAGLAERLATAPIGAETAGLGAEIAEAFTAHVAEENDLVLPRLFEDPQVDLRRLLEQMHHGMEAARADRAEEAAADPTARLLALHLEATLELARAGECDRACRLAAGAWAALRAPRPDLAAAVTRALHRLARLGEPASAPTAPTAAAEGERELDVRPLVPAARHEMIFATWAALAPGRGFVLVNDHDPKPLRYQFEAEHAGEVTWDTLEAGPAVWRVRIGRAVAVAS